MARQTMPLDEFMETFIKKAFDACGERFYPVSDEKLRQNMQSVITGLKGNVPKRFLRFLETYENPEKLLTDALEDIAGTQQEYPLFSRPGKFTRETFLEDITLQTVSHIVVAVFGPPTESGLKFTADIAAIYAFLKQKIEETMTENNEVGEDNGLNSTHINLREEEKKELTQKYATSIFSIHAFIKKVSNREISVGQYL